MTFVQPNVLINFVPFSAQVKFINGKVTGCRLVMKAVMNVEAAGSAVQLKTLNGNIQKVDMELFSASHNKNAVCPLGKQHFFLFI
jgi:hypothetical protein